MGCDCTEIVAKAQGRLKASRQMIPLATDTQHTDSSTQTFELGRQCTTLVPILQELLVGTKPMTPQQVHALHPLRVDAYGAEARGQRAMHIVHVGTSAHHLRELYSCWASSALATIDRMCDRAPKQQAPTRHRHTGPADSKVQPQLRHDECAL